MQTGGRVLERYMSVRIPRDIWRVLKLRALRRDARLSAELQEILRSALAKSKKVGLTGEVSR